MPKQDATWTGAISTKVASPAAKALTVDDIFKDSAVLTCLNTKMEAQNPPTKQNFVHFESTDAGPKASASSSQMKKQNTSS